MKSILLLISLIASEFSLTDFGTRARDFSVKLLYNVQNETDSHMVMSPFGIWSLLTGIAIGTQGSSQFQLTEALNLPYNTYHIVHGYDNLTKTVLAPETGSVSLISKNFMFIDEDLVIFPEYKSIMVTHFNATIASLNFKDPALAAKKANSIIKQSRASSNEVLKAEDFMTSRLIVTNAITLKGLWASPFNVSATQVEPFYDDNKRVIGEVKMMYQRAPLAFSVMQSIKASVLELPYGNDEKYCMLVVLPLSTSNVKEVFEKLKTTQLSEIFKTLQSDVDEYGLEEVDIKLPRFKANSNINLNKSLKKMNVTQIFDPTLASFSRMTKENIFVSSIVHEASIEVTETGTVASADTSAYFANRQSTPSFEANHPFIYLIMEKPTTTILFGGVYSKPSIF
ncbi:serine protease inhibitor 77Ba-like [Aricia agestis]|uniref:serine protease inhibitor 77Ba-like n=1 Tax=Aricia agestis TaxID=91739 RepID=UPI001C20932C|nr:serine protease inhibitor 77Ba-like [Aricia agestis]